MSVNIIALKHWLSRKMVGLIKIWWAPAPLVCHRPQNQTNCVKRHQQKVHHSCVHEKDRSLANMLMSYSSATEVVGADGSKQRRELIIKQACAVMNSCSPLLSLDVAPSFFCALGRLSLALISVNMLPAGVRVGGRPCHPPSIVKIHAPIASKTMQISTQNFQYPCSALIWRLYKHSNKINRCFFLENDVSVTSCSTNFLKGKTTHVQRL